VSTRTAAEGCARRYCRRRRVPPGGYRNVFEQFPLGPPLLAVSRVYMYVYDSACVSATEIAGGGGRRAHFGRLTPRLTCTALIFFFGGYRPFRRIRAIGHRTLAGRTRDTNTNRVCMIGTTRANARRIHCDSRTLLYYYC